MVSVMLFVNDYIEINGNDHNEIKAIQWIMIIISTLVLLMKCE